MSRVDEKEKTIKNINYFIDHLIKLKDLAEEELGKQEYEEFCDSSSTIQTYLERIITRKYVLRKK